MITLHARFAKQGFEGEADWRLICEMRQAVRVPLIGNGDVKTPEDARRMIDETGCDGVMVGRAAISNPWGLRSIRCGLTGEPDPGPPGLAERIEVALEHARAMVDYERRSDPTSPHSEVEARAIRALRGQLPLYIKGEPGAAALRQRITLCDSVTELEDILLGFSGQAKS
jgi:tRNA-dihydrouridine synthase